MTKHEFTRLQGIAENSLYSAGVMGQEIRHYARIFARSLAPGAILEMGPAEGLMTDELTLLGRPLTGVEGAEVFCEQIKARHPHISVVNTLLESFEPLGTFGNIILGHVLEHVEDPVGLLRKVHGWLEPGGRILAAVPNSRSLHR